MLISICMYEYACVCVCVYVCERERERDRERQRDRERDRETERQRDRERDRVRDMCACACLDAMHVMLTLHPKLSLQLVLSGSIAMGETSYILYSTGNYLLSFDPLHDLDTMLIHIIHY